MSNSNDEQNHKDLIQFAFSEFSKAISEAKSGKPPIKSYDKLKQIYDTLAEAEKKRANNEITDEEMQAKMADEVEKLKKEI